MNIPAYLNRINYNGALAPTIETLRGLHHAHMLAVPFENLDIDKGTPIVLDEAKLFDKIVTKQRGGFCYELNGLFAALLRELGFHAQILSAAVINEGRIGQPGAHITLLVKLEQRWLADVGFGDYFLEPLLLDDSIEQTDAGRVYRLSQEGDRWTVSAQGREGHPDGYVFSLIPYQLTDFVAMCDWTQTSPDSSFTQRRICSRATSTGRITLSDMRLLISSNNERTERLLQSESEYRDALRDDFGIVL